MRKIHALRIAVATGVAALAIAMVAIPSVMQADGATVITEFGCGLASWDSGLPGSLFTTDSQSVTTPSGNTKITCNFVVPDAWIPSKAMHNSGFWCGTFLGATTDSFVNVDTEGNAMLRCSVKANQN